MSSNYWPQPMGKPLPRLPAPPPGLTPFQTVGASAGIACDAMALQALDTLAQALTYSLLSLPPTAQASEPVQPGAFVPLLKQALQLPPELDEALQWLTQPPPPPMEAPDAWLLSLLDSQPTVSLSMSHWQGHLQQRLGQLNDHLLHLLANPAMAGNPDTLQALEQLMERLMLWQTPPPDKPLAPLIPLLLLYLPVHLVPRDPLPFLLEEGNPSGGEGAEAETDELAGALILYLTLEHLGRLKIAVRQEPSSTVQITLFHEAALTPEIQQRIQMTAMQDHLPALLGSRCQWRWHPLPSSQDKTPESPAPHKGTGPERLVSIVTPQLALQSEVSLSPVLVRVVFGVVAACLSVADGLLLTQQRAERLLQG